MRMGQMALESDTKLLDKVLNEFESYTAKLLANAAALLENAATNVAYVEVLDAYVLVLKATADLFDAYDDVFDAYDELLDDTKDARFWTALLAYIARLLANADVLLAYDAMDVFELTMTIASGGKKPRLAL